VRPPAAGQLSQKDYGHADGMGAADHDGDHKKKDASSPHVSIVMDVSDINGTHGKGVPPINGQHLSEKEGPTREVK
jgi:hypothetical protein